MVKGDRILRHSALMLRAEQNIREARCLRNGWKSKKTLVQRKALVCRVDPGQFNSWASGRLEVKADGYSFLQAEILCGVSIADRQIDDNDGKQ
jgi:hypothetical protein